MSEYVPPENARAPEIKKAIKLLAEDIQKESGSSKVIIICTFELNKKAGRLSIRMQVSADNTMERNDASPPHPAGEALTNEAEKSVRKLLKHKPEDKK